MYRIYVPRTILCCEITLVPGSATDLPQVFVATSRWGYSPAVAVKPSTSRCSGTGSNLFLIFTLVDVPVSTCDRILC